VLGGLESVTRELVRCKRITLVACGTAWHAALVGKYLIEEMARIPVPRSSTRASFATATR